MSAQRTVVPSGARSQSLTVACCSPPTYWIGFCTPGRCGSRRAQTLAAAAGSTGMGPDYGRVSMAGRRRTVATGLPGVYGAGMSSELPELFDRAQRRFGELVHEVRGDQWDAATPCSEWDVRTLVNHLVYEARWAPLLLEGKTIEEVGDRFDGDILGEKPAATYDDAAAGAMAAVQAPGALDRTVHLSYGESPAPGYLMQLTGDFVVHSWDLARAIGADERLDPELVDVVYDNTKPHADQLAASGLFDPPVDVADDADRQTKMLALFGRRA